MLSDIFVLTGFGLIDPILAIFIKEGLVGGTIFSAGLASMIFFLTKSIIQLPFSKHIDKTENKARWLILGTLLIAIVPFIYIFSSGIKMIYLAQLIHGIGSGLAYPTWLGLWSINLDRKQESFEWSLYSTLTGLGTATTAAVGAALAQFIGFTFTFTIVGIMSLVGCFVLLWLNENKKKMGPPSLLDEKITERTGRDKEFLER
jgi:DHA1 family quinolone resistance protein-like MFS transporter